VIPIFIFFAKVSPTSLELSSSFFGAFHALVLADEFFPLLLFDPCSFLFLFFLKIILAGETHFLLGIFLENHLIGAGAHKMSISYANISSKCME
jgi:hypothetical protein